MLDEGHDAIGPFIVSEWIDGGIPLAEIIRNGTPEQRDICGTRLFELTFDAPARVGMMHGDAHPGNFMLLPDGRMAVLDFGAFVRLPKCDVEAMLHISEVKDERIGSINDELAVGDLIDVMYLGQDDQGGLRVSKRRVGGEPQTRRRRGG